MLSRKQTFTVFFLSAITSMMLTVAEPRQNEQVNTNSHFESDTTVQAEKKKIASTFVEKEVSLKPIQPQSRKFWTYFERKRKENFNCVWLVSQIKRAAPAISILFFQ